MSTLREPFNHNENDPRKDGPGDVAQERRELLYHFLCYVFIIDGFYMSDMLLMIK
jgi:hypothetical protein